MCDKLATHRFVWGHPNEEKVICREHLTMLHNVCEHHNLSYTAIPLSEKDLEMGLICGDIMKDSIPDDLKIRGLIINRVQDLVGKFLYYDRKEDEDLLLGTIDKAVRDGVISVDVIVAVFRRRLVTDLNLNSL